MPNFMGGLAKTAEVRVGMSYYMPELYMDLITYPCPNHDADLANGPRWQAVYHLKCAHVFFFVCFGSHGYILKS